MSGENAASRQNCLKFLKRVDAIPRFEGDIRLDLVPEPTNPHDPDAIRVEFEYAEGKFFHLGYIPNSDSLCSQCKEVFERHPGTCPNCGSKQVDRCGTATRIKNELYAGWGVSGKAWAYVSEITGGGEGQSLGCNLEIHRED